MLHSSLNISHSFIVPAEGNKILEKRTFELQRMSEPVQKVKHALIRLPMHCPFFVMSCVDIIKDVTRQ